MQLAERGAVELGQAIFLDGVEAREAVFRAVAELDVEREGFEQLVLERAPR